MQRRNNMLTRDEFQDMMDETYPPYKAFGIEIGAGRVIRECDPELFNVLYHDYMNSMETEEA